MEFNFKTGIKNKDNITITSVPLYLPQDVKYYLKQQFKGEVKNDEIKFPKDLGERHPFDGKQTEAMYKNYGLVTGTIDKYVDFIVGPGFYVRSEDKRAEEIIKQFNQDVNMDTLLRAWIKEALLKPSGCLELGGSRNETIKGLKILDGNSIYVKRDSKGKILNYNQYKGDLDKFSINKVITFEEWQIAQLKINNLGDDAYGIGIIYPNMTYINNIIAYEHNMNILMERKANAPIHAQLGDIDNQPSADAISSFGRDLEWMNNKHEWTTPYYVNMKVLDFGKLGEKFDFPIQHNLNQFGKGVQIPKILMGEDVNMAVAPVQMDGFERRIQSIQAEVEKIIETKIYKRVLNSQGIDQHVEFEWGQPSNTEKNDRIKQITELLKLSTLSSNLYEQLQLELANLMNIPIDKIETAEQQKEELDNTKQPRVPGQNQKQMLKMDLDIDNVFKLQEKIYEEQEENECNCGSKLENKADYTLHEWLDFDFKVYLSFILDAINKDEFSLLAAITREDINKGMLGKTQINSLKRVLSNGFKNNKSILEITEDIKEKVKIKDLLNDEGKIKAISDNRAYLIARTETTRLSNLGANKQYKAEGIKKYRWVSTLGERTSDICRELNGMIFEVGKGPLPPAHPNCRSTTIPITED